MTSNERAATGANREAAQENYVRTDSKPFARLRQYDIVLLAIVIVATAALVIGGRS